MPVYTYRCGECGYLREVVHSIAEHDDTPPPNCPSCAFNMKRAYGSDAPQPAPMWPEHLNPSTGTVVRTRAQLQSDMDRAADDLYARTGIEQRNVVVDHSDLKTLRAPVE